MTLKNRSLTVGILFLMLMSCHEIDLADIENLNGNRIAIIGHGGGGFQSPNNPYPSNSEASILQAIENYNVDGIEVDVQISQDSILWLYHDRSLSSQTDCQGCIIDMKKEDLVSCRFQTDFDVNIFMDERLMRLEHLLEFATNRKIPPMIFLDIKDQSACSASNIDYLFFNAMLAQKLIDLITKYDAKSWVIIESQNRGLIREIRERDNAILLNYLSAISEFDLQFAIEENIFGITMNNDLADGEFIKRAHDEGLRVTLYNTKIRSAHIDAVEKNPDFIITDNILLLQQILK